MPQPQCQIDTYSETLAQLQTIFNGIDENSHMIIVGDFNAHFGKNIGPRGWGKSSKNAKHLQEFMALSHLQQ